MGWTPSNSETEADRRSVGATRFDPWQNRPDLPVRRQRAFGRPRTLAVWLAVFAVLVVGYTYHDDLAVAAARILSGHFPAERRIDSCPRVSAGGVAAACASDRSPRFEGQRSPVHFAAVFKRPRDADAFHLLPRRWVIERTFAWLGRNRRLVKDFERLIDTTTAMTVLDIIQLLMRRLASP